MTHSAADLTRWYLVAGGTGTDPHDGAAWPAYAGREPAAPDDALTVYDTDGLDHGRSMPTGEILGSQGVQVRVRSTDHRTGYSKAEEVRAALAAAYQEVVAPPGDPERYLVHCFSRIGDVIPLGREPGSSRYVFTVNAVTPVRQLS